MAQIVFILLLIFSLPSYAEGSDVIYETFAPLEINKLYTLGNFIIPGNLTDVVDRENKVGICIEEYVIKESKSYSKIVQENLYDLLNNIDKITAKIYGRKYQGDDKTSRHEKLVALARVQCEAYYSIGELN